ncbi:MAG: hypothetical protein AAF840_03190, partial [Bacteroidota bacterium]
DGVNEDNGRMDLSLFNCCGYGVDGVQPFFDAIGGTILPGDSIVVEYQVVMLQNPVDQNLNQNRPLGAADFGIFSLLDARRYLSGNSGSVTGNLAGRCTDTPAFGEFANPSVVGSSEITYDDCQAELVAKFAVEDIPSGWFTDEYRLVAGLEQVSIDLPFPYYYSGGATWETTQLPPTAIEPDSTSTTTVTAGGSQAYLPPGSITFTDAEFLNGVRPNGYLNYFLGDDDTRTVGGTFPLIGYDGATEVSDTITFRIPLKRACGEAPAADIEVSYNSANKYLPDLFMPDYSSDFLPAGDLNGCGRCQRFEVAGPGGTTTVVDNDGNLVNREQFPTSPSTFFAAYFPFNRLGGPNVNRERKTDQVISVTALNPPAAITGTSTLDNSSIMDTDPATETNGYELCVTAGTLPGGVLSIEMDNSVQFVGVSGDASSFELALVKDSSKVYAVAIPAGAMCFNIDLETELLFCDPGQICITPLLGCLASEVPAANQVALAAQTDLVCNDLQACYSYQAGATSVRTVFNFPPQVAPICADYTYTVTYTNDGTTPLIDFDPVVYLPLGLDPSGFMLSINGGAATALTAMNDPADNDVYGVGYTFDDPAFADFAIGDEYVITFTGTTTCDFNSGFPLSSRVQGQNNCGEDLSLLPERSIPVVLFTASDDDATFELEDTGVTQISCGAPEGTTVLLTGFNTGKNATSDITFEFILPAGISLNADAIVAVAPSDFMVGTITETPLPGGTTRYTFLGPTGVPTGGAVCLEVPIVIDDLECGLYEILYSIKESIDADCNGMACANTTRALTEEQFIAIEVTPPAAAEEGSVMVTAACGAAPGTFDVNYALTVESVSAPISGNLSFELYSDVDGDGAYNPAIDVQLSGPQPQAVDLAVGESTTVMGTFPAIDAAGICPLLLRYTTPGCTCSEVIVPISDIVPETVQNLGASAPLCPGETAMITDICADLDYTILPAGAGFVVDNDQVDGTVSYGLNPGFTTGTLVVTGTFGTCGINQSIPLEAQDPASFGPYEFVVCTEGSQQVDLGIPFNLMEDVEINITPTIGLDDPTSAEPVITDLAADQVYNVEISLPGGCTAMTTMTVTVQEAVQVALNSTTGCSTGFNLADILTVTPVDINGTFTTQGDGAFSPSAAYPGVTTYTPGPEDLAAGEVRLRFATESPDGPCGPGIIRQDLTVLLVDCGSFNWDGEDR